MGLAIGTSLSVMISNNLISMFALDRKYIMYAVTAEKLKGLSDGNILNYLICFALKHISKIGFFFGTKSEKIKRLQVIAEFTDDSDKNHEPNPANAQSPDNSDNDDSDSDNTPRSPDTPPPKSHRKIPHSSRKHKNKTKYNPEVDEEEDDDYNKNNVVIDLQQIPQTRNESIQVAQQTFKQNFNTSSLRTSIENNITENVNNAQENIEDNVDETLGDLGKEIHSNLKNKNE